LYIKLQLQKPKNKNVVQDCAKTAIKNHKSFGKPVEITYKLKISKKTWQETQKIYCFI
jgi:hypothetical protein